MVRSIFGACIIKTLHLKHGGQSAITPVDIMGKDIGQRSWVDIGANHYTSVLKLVSQMIENDIHLMDISGH